MIAPRVKLIADGIAIVTIMIGINLFSERGEE